MSPTEYAMVAYAAGLGLLFGYGLLLWIEGRVLHRRIRSASEKQAETMA